MMTEEMKAKLAPYFNSEKGIYDLRAIASDFDSKSEEDVMFDSIFDFDEESGDAYSKSPETEAAEYYNLHRFDIAKDMPENQGDIVAESLLADNDLTAIKVKNRVKVMHQEQIRRAAAIIVATLKRIDKQFKNAKITRELSVMNNRCLFILEHMDLGQSFGDTDYQSLGVNISSALDFVAGIEVQPTHETEEFLASLGL